MQESELARQMQKLTSSIEQSNRVDSLFQCSNCGMGRDGWNFLEEELKKILTGIKMAAVAPTLIGDIPGHASLVGAHNAIQSLLDQLHAQSEHGKINRARLAEMRIENKDALEELGI